MSQFTPSEEQEQKALAQWLDYMGILYTATANGARTSIRQAVKLKTTGCKKGTPDILIFDPVRLHGPKSVPLYVGCALELKRKAGGKVSPEQRQWLQALEQRGWVAIVAKGAGEAISMLQSLGYGRKR